MVDMHSCLCSNSYLTNALEHITVKRKVKLHPVYEGITTCILPAAVGVLGTSGGTLGKE
jgi:hypothetical protein